MSLKKIKIMNCPKCNALLFRTNGRQDAYYCMGCALEGTYAEMSQAAKQIQRNIEGFAPRFCCKSCEGKFLFRDLVESKWNYVIAYLCKECENKIKRTNVKNV